jgi:hypothetical protein
MYGAGYADDWIGRYMNKNSPKSRKSMLKEFSHTTLFDGLASKLRRTDQPIFGSLVTTSKCKHWVTGCSLGISVGSRAVFLSESGLFKVNVEDVESSWVLK